MDDIQWSDVEKSQLLAALRRNGAQDLNALRQAIPGRSLIAIRRAIDHYKQRAHLSWVSRRTPDCLREWIEVMVKLCPEGARSIQDLVPRALKYLALFEPHASGDLDLSALYMYLSQLACEYPTKALSSRERLLLNASLERLEKLGRVHDSAQLRAHLQQLEPPLDAPPLNPLGLPEDLLANKTR